MGKSSKDGARRGGHTEARRWSREYWSPRHPGMLSWGTIGKQLTHELERAKSKESLITEAAEAIAEVRYDAAMPGPNCTKPCCANGAWKDEEDI
jgi:hypothetical protein